MELIKDDELTWLGVAGHVAIIYVIMLFAKVVSGDELSVFVLANSFGEIFAACLVAGLICALISITKYKFIKATFFALTIVTLLISKVGIQAHKAKEQHQPINHEQAINEQSKEVQLQDQLKILARAHPDFAEIASSKRFLSWVERQPARVQKLYSSELADDNIILLDLYKAELFKQDASRKDFVQKMRAEADARSTQ